MKGCENQKSNKNQEVKKKKQVQSFKTKQQEVLLSGNTLGF
ncbi:hypothetical protein [Helicobacter pylori]